MAERFDDSTGFATAGVRPKPFPGATLHRVNFYCNAAGSKQVLLAGDFNHWVPTATPMTRRPDGTWFATLELRHGHHLYYFVVDGKPVLDPKGAGTAKNERGEPASLIAVS